MASGQSQGMLSHLNESLYSDIVAGKDNTDNEIETAEGYNVKPIFIKEADVRAPGASYGGWVEEDEVIEALVKVVHLSHLKGVQRIYTAWRIYVDNIDDRIKLLSLGVVMRNRSIQVLPNNPNRPMYCPVSTTRLVVSNIPLSIYDGQINRELEQMGCVIISSWRQKIRYRSKLTYCDNGKRIVIVVKLKKDIPKYIDISTYRGQIWYYGKPKESVSNDFGYKKCKKCKQEGHLSHECENEIVCDGCGNEGHRRNECPAFSEDEAQMTSDESETEENDGGNEDADVEGDGVRSEQEIEDGTEDVAGDPNDKVDTEDAAADPTDKDDAQKETTDDAENKTDKAKSGKGSKDKKKDSKEHKKQKGKTSSGPMDDFLKAAKNRNDVLLTPKGKVVKPKTRTPPSTSKDDDKAKRDKKVNNI